MNMKDLRKKILKLVEEFAQEEHKATEFIPGQTPVPVSGKVYGKDELRLLVDASLDFWLTTGRFNHEFENKLAAYVGTKHSLTVNSGSSANLLAVSALTSDMLGDRKLQPGDEVITVAAGFPTTVNPILQNGLVPVFLDVDIPTYNVIAADIEAAITERTRAIVLAHSLGNPFNLDAVKKIREKYDLWLIEDCCDALGSQYQGKMVGTFGDIATVSFYPAHHITMGEGGAVLTSGGRLKRVLESLRDWGRDCWCAPGESNTCNKRFDWHLGELPYGYDHKYIYSHLGYNLKITDMQAAIGLAQLKRIDSFHKQRKENFSTLETGLADLQEFLVLPRATEGSEPSWFGFPITIHEDAPFDRNEIVRFLEKNQIATRNLFAGNLVKQPYMLGRNYRVPAELENTDRIMTSTFWIGVYPGLNDLHMDYIIDCFHSFIGSL
ncbi:MAG: lipopolysaccharide biosynthesis protein RfbH [Gammaproteobacteria bacterium]|nr:lipopolysaccharide biosynthesis protein RfbH [Gammaproteobacteria bacterium]